MNAARRQTLQVVGEVADCTLYPSRRIPYFSITTVMRLQTDRELFREERFNTFRSRECQRVVAMTASNRKLKG